MSSRQLSVMLVSVLSYFVFLLPVQAKNKISTPDAILGKWTVLDSRTGLPRGILDARKDKNGNYYFVNVKSIDPKGVKSNTHCDKCPKPFKGKKVVGMTLLWNIKPVAGKLGQYKSAYGIDPKSGRLFRGSMKLRRNGDILKIRATPLDTSVLFQTMVWVRKK